ncbi:MAG: hypothetical protein LW875_03085 [Proteobacteria bacterium]|jgi:hypothetical protein|nr:hypothetical protein [Pseudomonadota bacterium]
METRNFLFFFRRASHLSLLLNLMFLSACQMKTARVQDSSPLPTPRSEAPAPAPTPSLTSEAKDLPVAELPPKEPLRLAVVLGPGYVRSYAYAGLLAELHRAKIPVVAVSGLEMGALAAGIYAMKGQGFEVEWQMMKLKDSDWSNKGLVGGVKPLEITSLNKFIGDVFQGSRIEDAKIGFSCPSLQLNTRFQSTLVSRGPWVQALPFCLALPPQSKFGQSLAGIADLKSVVDQLRRRGANHIVYIGVLGSNPQRLPLEWALYQQTLQLQAGLFDQSLVIDLSEYELTDFDRRRDMIKRGQQFGTQWAQQLIKKFDL